MKNIINISEVMRFIINGLIATAVHFLILYLCINFLMLNYYGISNLIGSVFGALSSFFGNRVFVFKNSKSNIFMQSSKFLMLYTIMAINHGLFLYYWSDISNHNYIIGFVLITMMNTMLSYFCNKYKVFN